MDDDELPGIRWRLPRHLSGLARNDREFDKFQFISYFPRAAKSRRLSAPCFHIYLPTKSGASVTPSLIRGRYQLS